MNKYETIHDAYLATLEDVYDNPDHIAEPRGQRTREKLNYQFTVLNPKPDAIITKDEKRNITIKKYSDKEFEIYDGCSNSAKVFGEASKFWLTLANPDGTVNSAYGHLIWKKLSHGNPFEFTLEKHQCTTRAEYYRLLSEGAQETDEPYVLTVKKTVYRTPWEWAKLSLVRDKDTRQAILRFSLPEHQWMGNKDQTCTLHGIFMIRENKLNLSINMRSNDLTLGLVYDLPWFISLMYKMRDELSNTYPDLEIGTYSHYVHSLHIYDRDEDKILKMLGRK